MNGPPALHRHVRWLEVRSRLLEGNPMGNPAERVLGVLLPPGFSPARRYPVVWMLDGFGGRGATMLNHAGALGVSLGERLLRLQHEGTLPPVLFAFPDGATRLGGSQYVDSAACGPFMSHVVDELVPLVDAELPTLAAPETRVLAGHSSGGFGALATAMLRPGTFGAVIASAADSAFDLSMPPAIAAALPVLEAAGGVQGLVDRVLGSPRAGRLPPGDFAAVSTVALATCYSPDVAAPGLCRLPVDPHAGEWDARVWARWMAWDPVRMAARHADTLRGLWHLHLDCGARDEYAAQYGHRRLARVLACAGIPALHTEFPGGHDAEFRWEDRFAVLAPLLRERL